jgi:hypothetical protein
MRKFVFGCVTLSSVALLFFGPSQVGCTIATLMVPSFDFDAGDANFSFSIRGVGQSCDAVMNICRPGLACQAGKCEPGHSSAAGTACVISAECSKGLYCGPEHKCAKAGAGASGSGCASDAECASGLRCNLQGLRAECQTEGTVDIGGKCAKSSECFGGLMCAEGVCLKPPAGMSVPVVVPTFKGVECEAESGPVTAHFRVPRGEDDKDYFRLPFPNDIRTKAGHVDLTGFPTPGADLLGFDLVDRWARFVEETASGFSAYPTVTFRFSDEVDLETLKEADATRWIDISPSAGNDLGHGWTAGVTRTAYVCPNHVSVRPPRGAPLLSGHTYAVFITTRLKAKDGKDVVIADDLKALLSASAPTESSSPLGKAYTAYAPLRAWATKTSFDTSKILNAAVFTVGQHDDLVKKLTAMTQAAPLPAAKGWVACGTGPSPCAQADGERACPSTPDPAFDELHALVSLPIFQKGTTPYLEPSEGGGFELDGAGRPMLQRTEDVCMSLTVPKGTMPEQGWPLVIYAHGTGGSFRSHVPEGVAARLANVDGAQKIAVLGIDQVGHGTRRGTSTSDPANVFYNILNPAAARGNVLQGAADQVSLVRFATQLSLPSGTSPTGKAIRFNRIAFWGHSQGATEGSVVLPYVSGVAGAVLSGAGGSLIDSLLTKKSPVNLAALGPLILSESPSNITTVHPALALFQNAIDAADPLNHAVPLTKPGPLAKHVFVPFGQLDTYTPPVTQLSYVLAAGLGIVEPPAGVTKPDNFGLEPAKLPISGNNGGHTAVVRQYSPLGYDGHFVAFRDLDAKKNTDRFLADVLSGVVPSFGR